MDEKTKSRLERAERYCYEWRLPEAYGIFRRFFDRLPFRPEPAHAQYIGLFVRVLLELGKVRELSFYMVELERLYAVSKEAGLGYQLAYVYMHVPEPRLKAAKEILEKISADPAARALHAKAKVMLLSYYDRQDDYVACRQLLDSIQLPKDDAILSRMIRLWQANIRTYYEKRHDEAEAIVSDILKEVTFQSEWITYFSARASQARIALAKGKTQAALAILAEMHRIFEKRRCKSIQYELECLGRLFQKRDEFATLRYIPGQKEHCLIYANKTLTLNPSTKVDKLLLLLVKQRYLPREKIVRRIQARPYEPSRDDKWIHFQITSLRKRLQELGLSEKAVLRKANGYRLVPPVEILEE